MRREAELMRDLAREAALLAAGLQGRVRVRDKGAGLGPVTEADLAVEELLLAGIRAEFPGDPILSEETSPQVARPAPRLWCVDPIDGTHEYARGLKEYAVQIGLLEGGEPVGGAIAMPGAGRLLWGFRGGGVRVEEAGATREVRLDRLEDLSRATVVHTRRHMSDRLKRAVGRLGARRLRGAGGVGYKVALILLGEAHLYLHTGGGTRWWDSAGPAALCLEAGGSVADAHGEPLDFTAETLHRKGLLFAVPGLLGPAVRLLKDEAPPGRRGRS